MTDEIKNEEYYIRKAKYGHIKTGDWVVALHKSAIKHKDTGVSPPKRVTLKVGRIFEDYSGMIDSCGHYIIDDWTLHVPCVRLATDKEIEEAERREIRKGDLCLVSYGPTGQFLYKYFSHYSVDGEAFFFKSGPESEILAEYALIHKV